MTASSTSVRSSKARERAVAQTAQRLEAQFGDTPGLRHARPAYWRAPADRAVAAGWKARQAEVDARDAVIRQLRYDILLGPATELPATPTTKDTVMPAPVDGTLTRLNETSRTYTFPLGTVTFHDVTELIVRPSGSHRLRTRDGKLHVVAVGWMAISVDDASEEWTL